MMRLRDAVAMAQRVVRGGLDRKTAMAKRKGVRVRVRVKERVRVVVGVRARRLRVTHYSPILTTVHPPIHRPPITSYHHPPCHHLT